MSKTKTMRLVHAGQTDRQIGYIKKQNDEGGGEKSKRLPQQEPLTANHSIQSLGPLTLPAATNVQFPSNCDLAWSQYLESVTRYAPCNVTMA